MQEKRSFDYAVIRLVPRVEREEFLNVGVILYAQEDVFLGSAFFLDETRLSCFSTTLTLEEIRDHLAAFERICSGGPGSGPIGALSPGERFRWLTAPRSTIVQTSPVHTGLTADPAATLEHLMQRLVRT